MTLLCLSRYSSSNQWNDVSNGSDDWAGRKYELPHFGAVSVAPHGGEHVLVYVRVASPLAQAESKQSQ